MFDMKVVDIINLSSSANTLLKERVLAMRRNGIDNRILCIDGPYVLPLRRAGIPVHTVHLPRGFNPVKAGMALVEIADYLRRHHVDLVHTHCSVPGAIGRLAARWARVPVVVHTVHGFHFHDHSGSLRRLPFVAMERMLGRFTDVLLTQNRGDLERAERHRIGPSGRRWWIGNGIDLDRFRPVRRFASSDIPTITCVARLEPVKGHRMLFEALRVLARRGERFRVWLVGEGPMLARYRREVQRLGIEDGISFLGYRNDIPDLLARTDIAVLTSEKEGLPRAALEAMAMEVPVVATRVTGTQEVVRHGETGLTVEPGDVEGLAAALSFLASDQELRIRMGRAGRRVAIEEYDERAVVDSLMRIYRAQVRWGLRPIPAAPPSAAWARSARVVGGTDAVASADGSGSSS